MPSVKMRTTSGGPSGGRIAGHTYPVSAEEGDALVRGGYASWVEAPASAAPVVETAAIEPPAERAVRPTARRRKP